MHETLLGLVASYGDLVVFLVVGVESLGIPLPGGDGAGSSTRSR
jgi:hypothetical protein